MRYPKFDPTLSKRGKDQLSETAYGVSVMVAELEARTGKTVCKFHIGQPLEKAPDNICNEAIAKIRGGFHGYTPALGIITARKAIAKYFSETRGIKVDWENVSIEQGAKIYIHHAIFATTDYGRGEVIYTVPGYPIYESAIKDLGAIGRPIFLYEKNGFDLDVDELGRMVNPNTCLIIINSPQNPIGVVYPRYTLNAIAKIVKKHPKLRVLSDEVYGHFSYDSEFVSIASLPGMQKRTIIMDGLSKKYAMTGWRLGFATASSEIIKSFGNNTTNLSGCANHMTQLATIVALEGSQDVVNARVDSYRERRDLIVKLLNDIPGVTCLIPGGAFYVYPNVTEACKIVGAKDAREFHERLLNEALVSTTADTHFGQKVPGDGEHTRFSYVCSEEVIIEGTRRTKEWVTSHIKK